MRLVVFCISVDFCMQNKERKILLKRSLQNVRFVLTHTDLRTHIHAHTNLHEQINRKTHSHWILIRSTLFAFNVCIGVNSIPLCNNYCVLSLPYAF